MYKIARTLSALFVSCLVISVVAPSLARSDEGFRHNHPRRAQVNRRERNQQKRIANGVKSGKMSAQQASKIEGEEAAIKKQEISEVKANGGHLTRKEQGQLNQELNGVSKEIYQDKHPGAK